MFVCVYVCVCVYDLYAFQNRRKDPDHNQSKNPKQYSKCGASNG